MQARISSKENGLLQLLNQNNAANIPYDGENREPVQLITEFFIDEAISYVEEGARLIGGALIGGADEHNTSDCGDELESAAPMNTTRATAETNWKT